MCDNLSEWIDTHPTIAEPPPRTRRPITVYLSPEEHEDLARVSSDPRLWHIYKGKQYQVLRHALNAYLPGLMLLLEEGYRPMAEMMRADLERAGLGQTLEQINEYYSTRGRELLMLTDAGELDRAFQHYEHVLDFVKARDGVWRGLLIKLLYEHPEMSAWRTAIKRLGHEHEERLRMAEEEVHD